MLDEASMLRIKFYKRTGRIDYGISKYCKNCGATVPDDLLHYSVDGRMLCPLCHRQVRSRPLGGVKK